MRAIKHQTAGIACGARTVAKQQSPQHQDCCDAQLESQWLMDVGMSRTQQHEGTIVSGKLIPVGDVGTWPYNGLVRYRCHKHVTRPSVSVDAL
jgi:hypothetical protein